MFCESSVQAGSIHMQPCREFWDEVILQSCLALYESFYTTFQPVTGSRPLWGRCRILQEGVGQTGATVYKESKHSRSFMALKTTSKLYTLLAEKHASLTPRKRLYKRLSWAAQERLAVTPGLKGGCWGEAERDLKVRHLLDPEGEEGSCSKDTGILWSWRG